MGAPRSSAPSVVCLGRESGIRPTPKMGNACSNNRGNGTAMCWTKTTIPALQGDSEVHKKFGLCKAALAEIPGKTIFGFYRTQFNDQWGCELFIAWDSAIALEDARADVCIALLPVLPEGSATMTEAEFDTYTVRH